METKIRLFDVTDFTNGRFEELTDGVDYELKNPLSTHGKTFTPRAASHLIFEKLNQFKLGDENKMMAIEFSKSSLLQILLQEDCEGIRFTRCMGLNESGQIDPAEESLVAIGLDSTGKPIGHEFFTEGYVNPGNKPVPIAKEKGNKVKVSAIRMELQRIIEKKDFEVNFLRSFF
jgi:hypothetical protein